MSFLTLRQRLPHEISDSGTVEGDVARKVHPAYRLSSPQLKELIAVVLRGGAVKLVWGLVQPPVG